MYVWLLWSHVLHKMWLSNWKWISFLFYMWAWNKVQVNWLSSVTASRLNLWGRYYLELLSSWISRGSHSEVFLVKCVLKICSKFTEEHRCQSVITMKLRSNFIEITLRHGCSPVNLLRIFRTPLLKNTSGGLLLYFWNAALEKNACRKSYFKFLKKQVRITKLKEKQRVILIFFKRVFQI